MGKGQEYHCGPETWPKWARKILSLDPVFNKGCFGHDFDYEVLSQEEADQRLYEYLVENIGPWWLNPWRRTKAWFYYQAVSKFGSDAYERAQVKNVFKKIKMLFKKPKFEDQLLGEANGLLRALVEHINLYAVTTFKKPIIVTRVTDKVEGESGVHTWGGAADLRLEYWQNGKTKMYFTIEQAEQMAAYFNDLYGRNDGRLTIVIHRFDGGMLHFHVQIAPLIERYKPS